MQRQEKPGAIPVPSGVRSSLGTPRGAQVGVFDEKIQVKEDEDDRPTTASEPLGTHDSTIRLDSYISYYGEDKAHGRPVHHVARHESSSFAQTDPSSLTTARTTPERWHNLAASEVDQQSDGVVAQEVLLAPHQQDALSVSGLSSISKFSHYPPPPDASQPVPRIFLFVNPTSGGNAAAAFTNAGLTHANLKTPDAELFIADIRDGASAHKPAFLQLKDLVDEVKLVNSNDCEILIAIMAGGDGTVLWGISEMWEHHIDDKRVAIGVIPYGTGNDFAKALGWDSFNHLNPFTSDMQLLKMLIEEWIRAPVVSHDIWSIDITVKPTGEFSHIDSKTRRKVVLLDPCTNTVLKTLKKKVNNYFSIGVESKIGIGFDRHRKTNKFQNKLVYMNEGIKKILLHRAVRVDRMMEKMVTMENGFEENVFSSELENKGVRELLKCGSLIALNIPSFAAGLDIWKNASRLGLKGDDIRTMDKYKKLMVSPQVLGDGQLEWVSFSGASSLGTEQLVEGLGRRVHQGKGPFCLSFKNSLPNDQRVYFQIDGEYYQMTEPQKIEISLFRKIKCLANSRSSRVVRALDSF